MKLLVLYMELADYTVSCLKALKKSNPEVEIHTIAYPVNDEAPFQFDFSEIGQLCDRNKFDYEKIQLFSDKLKPDLIICSGWVDRSYLKVIRTWRRKAVTVLCMDNKWEGTLKQHIASIGARLYLPRIFNYLWVPFHQHAKFGRRMGFAKRRIKLGFYSTETKKYKKLYQETKSIKAKDFPKKFICVARYIDAKNLDTLWQAFISANEKMGGTWELWNLGKGENWEARNLHPTIKHKGFVQPEEIANYMKATGVFVLASTSEPWGVVVHQFASAGFPMLVSKKVGAHEAFVQENKNGFTFNPLIKSELEDKMIQLMKMDTQELTKLGEESSKLSEIITEEKWINTLFEMSNKQ